jgi:hypothetical protein
MLTKAMTIHKLLAKKHFEVNFGKIIIMLFFRIHMSLDQIVMNDSKFKCYVTYSLSM